MYTQQPASQLGANHCQPSLIASRTAAIYNCVRGGDIISFRLANHMVGALCIIIISYRWATLYPSWALFLSVHQHNCLGVQANSLAMLVEDNNIVHRPPQQQQTPIILLHLDINASQYASRPTTTMFNLIVWQCSCNYTLYMNI